MLNKKTMKPLLFSIALIVLGIEGASAQFVIEKTDGTTQNADGSLYQDVKISGNDKWRIGGVLLSDISRISVKSAEERLGDYVGPTYADYYRSISSWADRSKWNLSNVHDPSVMLADDGYFYMYTTDATFGGATDGTHFHCRRSRDLVNWEYLGGTMKKLPLWVHTKLDEIRADMGLGSSTVNFNDESQFGFWAPCARRVSHDLYRLYYAITIPGTINGAGTWGERCFIGLMETATPDKINSWEDKGYVLTNASDKGLNFNVAANDWANCYFKWNAIDPSYIITPEGQHWLIYGSWHSGFAVVELNPETGKTKAELGKPWGADTGAYGSLVATRQMGNRWQASEAPEVVYHDGYYYLFMAYDALDVPYNTRVVRSRSITGPYLGIDGTDVTTNGGDAYPLVTHPYKFNDNDGWVGISHCAIFSDAADNWYYASQGRLPAGAFGDDYSNAIMVGQVRRIIWTDTKWPVVLPERYGAVPQSPISESELVGQWQHINLQYAYGQQCAAAPITLNADHTITGSAAPSTTWTYNADTKVLRMGTKKLYLARETDWESTDRHPTIVYAGIDGKKTYWGKKN